MYYDAENRSKQQEETRIQQKLQQVLQHKNYFEQEIQTSKSKLQPSKPFQQNNLSLEEEDKTLEGRDFTICIRARPMLKHEITKNYFTIVTANNPDMVLHNAKLNVKCQPVVEDQAFNVDYAFGPQDSNDVVYEQTGKPLIKLALEGGLGAMFAYGQTGSGKTFTMQGVQKLVANDVFKFNTEGHDIFVGFFELLGNKASCLLENSNKVDILEDQFGKVQAKGVKEVQVTSGDQFLDLINTAQQNRKTQATFKNDVSSRTHSVAQVRIKNNKVPAAEDGYLYIIDLVGSENASDSQFHDQKLFKETKDINKSLMALKECIRNRALASVDNKYIHVPFRQSKLTLLLKDSFDMDSFRQTKTVVIANIAPSIADKEQTINTLRYAAPIKVSTKNKKQMPINPDNPQFWDNAQIKEYFRKVCFKYNKKIKIDQNQFLPFQTGKQVLMLSEAEFIQKLVALQYPEQNAKQVHDQFYKKFIDNRFADRKKLQNKAGKLVQPEMNFQGKHTDKDRDEAQQKQNQKKKRDSDMQKQIFSNKSQQLENQEEELDIQPVKKPIKQPPSQKPFTNNKNFDNEQQIQPDQENIHSNQRKPVRQQSAAYKSNNDNNSQIPENNQNPKRISALASQGQQIVKSYQEKQKINRENLQKLKEERKQKMLDQQKAQEEKHYQIQQQELQQREAQMQQNQQQSMFIPSRQQDEKQINNQNLNPLNPNLQQPLGYNNLNSNNRNRSNSNNQLANNNLIPGFQNRNLDQDENKFDKYRQVQQIQKNQIEEIKNQQQLQQQQQDYFQKPMLPNQYTPQNNYNNNKSFHAPESNLPNIDNINLQKKVQGFSEQGLHEEEQRYFQYKRKEQDNKIQHQKSLISQQKQDQQQYHQKSQNIYDKTQELPSFPPQPQTQYQQNDNINKQTEYNNLSNNYSQKPPRAQWNKNSNLNLPNMGNDQVNKPLNQQQQYQLQLQQLQSQQQQVQPNNYNKNYNTGGNNIYDDLAQIQQRSNQYNNNPKLPQQGMNYYPNSINNNINKNNYYQNQSSPYSKNNYQMDQQSNNYGIYSNQQPLQNNISNYQKPINDQYINNQTHQQDNQQHKFSNFY